MSENKKNDNGMVSGILLISIGLIALIVTFFDLRIVWTELAKLWPVFLIIFGISILPFNKAIKSVSVIVLLLLSCLLYYQSVKDDNDKDETCYESINNADVDVQEFYEPYKNLLETASVNVEYGAGTLRLNPPVNELVKASNTSNNIVQDFSVLRDGTHADIEFEIEKSISMNAKDINSNYFNIALNDNPVYDFKMSLGACTMNFDFSEYKVSKIEVESGACDIDMKLGDMMEMTEVELETGVSDINIGVPSESGCRIECESVLSNKDFEGFVKKSGNVYETSNYSYAKNVIDINFSGAVSDVRIYRY